MLPFSSPYWAMCYQFLKHGYIRRTEKEEEERDPVKLLVERCCKRALRAEREDAGRAVGTAAFPLMTIFWNIVPVT